MVTDMATRGVESAVSTSSAANDMQALVSCHGRVELRRAPIPRLDPQEVLIRVHAVGLCRTDLYVISGDIPAKNNVIPGHEFAGTVADVGDLVRGLSIGQRVAINPLIACGQCLECQADLPHDCRRTEFLGVDRDGALAEFVAVPATSVLPISAALPWLVAAFAEPVAATLAVLKANIRPDQRGLVFGTNRIAKLTLRILQSAGFNNVSICSERAATGLAESHFDYIVETAATTETLAQMVHLLRPRGRIILKSRPFRAVGLSLRELLPKEPVFEAVHYGRFDKAVELLENGELAVDDLIGKSFLFQDFQRAFADARADEREKTFLILREE